MTNRMRSIHAKQEADVFGETYTVGCCKPGESKVKAMPALTCKKQVLSFIGIFNCLSKFSVQLSELVEPIRELSKEM